MAVYEKGPHEPFLHGDSSSSSSSRAGSLELPVLNTKLGYHRQHHGDTPPTSPSDQLEFEEATTLPHKPHPPAKRSATYAILFMLAAQVFSASMNVSIRLLENASTHLHPFQILFVRMSVTTLGITMWLWKQHKPNNILGKRDNRLLLLVRAFGGFLGVFGLYCKSIPPQASS